MHYVPILRGKAGELTALGEISAHVRDVIRPVLEVVPDERLRDVVRTFSTYAGDLLPANLTVTVDCGRLWSRGPVGTGFPGHALQWVSSYLDEFRQPLIPALRATDLEGALDEVRQIQLTHGQGGCLRQSIWDLPNTPRELGHSVDAALDRVALSPDRVDLILDAGYLSSAHDVMEAAGRTVEVLVWAASRPWRHIAVAGGAFPPSLQGVTPRVITPLPRREIELWHRVKDRLPGRPPDFADHGVTHPTPPRSAFGRARANLRYTRGLSWHVVRSRGGMDTISLCRDLETVAAWPADPEDLPWGDQQLLARARGREQRPGGPRNWRAWETSHHLAAVAGAIAEHGAP